MISNLDNSAAERLSVPCHGNQTRHKELSNQANGNAPGGVASLSPETTADVK